jgi:acyl-lipid omega-3 desaturase
MCISDYQRSILADNKKVSQVLNISNLKDQMPPAVFEKSLLKAFFYMFFDFGMVFASVAAIVYLHSSGIYATLPQWQQYAATFVYWNVAGFFMWGLFVVGHDCGHGTFSDSTILNDIIGHLTHGSILVPYYPWQLSHRRHHMNHNHVDKDYSHPWYTPDKLEKPEFWLARMMEDFPFARFVFPFIGWPLYLYGMPDGSHWIPFSDQRLWKDTDKQEYGKCVVSTAVVLANCAAIYYLCEQVRMKFHFFVSVHLDHLLLFFKIF